MNRSRIGVVFPLLAFLWAAAPAAAQCQNFWLAGDTAPAPSAGDVEVTTMWDPDGAGPQAPLLVVAGSFTGPVPGANNIATFDRATGRWGTLDIGTDAAVLALATLPNGDLIAGGRFTTAGIAPAARIARWNGTSWSPLGAGLDGANYPYVGTLAVLPNGDLAVAGTFDFAGGAPASNVARWDGTAWSPMGAGSGYHTRALTLDPNGTLFAAGRFGTAVGVGRWNGSAWTLLPVPVFNVTDLAFLPNGDLVAAGWGADSVQRWNGTAWTPLGTNPNWSIEDLHVLANGDLVAAGAWNYQLAPASNVARWDGTQWTPLGPGTDFVVSTVAQLPSGELLAGGNENAISPHAPTLQTFDGTSWVQLGAGLNGAVRAFAVLPDGRIVAGGGFTMRGTTRTRHVATSTGPGSPWTQLGTGIHHPRAFALAANGDLLATGFATQSSLVVGRWNGSSWTSLGSMPIGTVHALAVAPNGDVIAGGELPNTSGGQSLARHASGLWTALATPLGGIVRAVQVDRAGKVIAGGDFTQAGGQPLNHVGVSNGVLWAPFGPGLDGNVHCLVLLRNGDLVAGGSFATSGSSVVNGIARWDGNAWLPFAGGMAGGLGPTTVHTVIELPTGDLVAGGDFATAGGVTANGLARWNGTSWSPVAGGTNGIVHALALAPNDDLLVGGEFTEVGGQPSAFFARLSTTCPATATSYGAVCAGSAGLVSLVPTTLPWIGSTYEATCSGVVSGAIVFGLFGFASINVPISFLHPAGTVGCLVLARPDWVPILTQANGTATARMVIPVAPALVGTTFFNQAVQMELGSGSVITRLNTSNGLRLTIGSF